MQQLLLIRPGVTDYDSQGRIQGVLDVPLSDEGLQQVEAAVDEIVAQAPSAVYAGPCESAQQTAEILAERLQLKPKTLDKLTNLDHGLWQGMLIEDVRNKQPKIYRQWQEQPETVCPPEGETVLAAESRVAGVLKKLLKKHRNGERVALVAPEPLASLIRHVVRQDELGNLWKAAEGCGSWEALDMPAELVGVG